MDTRSRQVLDHPRFALAAAVARRLAGRRVADPLTLQAVAVLTASADPARAERLRPRANEPAPLVERLMVWALPLADDDAVRRAAAVLDHGRPAGPVEGEPPRVPLGVG